jgi:polyribonucleotide nucleotidyltransferase
MKPQGITKTVDLGDGRIITVETGILAKQAHGSVVMRMGETMLLATVVANKHAKDDVDFMPLTVDYREKYASTGKFPGGFFKREARPSDDETLVCRLIDRALRPLFPDDFHAETQVLVQFISGDRVDQPDALACFAASCALSCSDIPFAGPVSEARVARINGEFKINPTFADMEHADIDMMIAGTMKDIMMVEGEMSEISEQEMIDAIAFAHEAIKKQCAIQMEFTAELGMQEKREYSHEPADIPELKEKLKAACFQGYYDVAAQGNPDRKVRATDFNTVKDAAIYIEDAENEEGPAANAVTMTQEYYNDNKFIIKKYLYKLQKEAIREMMLDKKTRLDGRATTEVRGIWSEVDYLPGCHGSAVFTRGETQSLTTLTLGTKMDEQTIDGANKEGKNNFLLHYNFPPFSTGEARFMRGTSRREIGHGNLALRALKPVIPGPDANPYTIRIVSDILESNGSSSMATVCAGTLALMDGGIKIIRPVSGIAMGMVSGDDGRYVILSDILGDEDHLGDMDFKVTGTEKGITACQMDIKIDGLKSEILTEALMQAREGRLHILGEMAKTMDAPREDYKSHAPRIVKMEVPTDVIGAIIGPGGKIIQEIQKETGTVITIEEKDNKGHVEVSSSNKEDLDRAVKRVRDIAFPATVEIGEEYEGKVKSVMPYGAFVEIVPGIDGLLHISELEWGKVDKVEDILKEGDMTKFKVTGKDPRNGKLKLSRKVLLPKPEGVE